MIVWTGSLRNYVKVLSQAQKFACCASSRLPILPSQNEAASELSDPEDDILPPPMGPISDRARFIDSTSTPKPQAPSPHDQGPVKDRGYRPGPAGAASVDSAVESWEGSSAETQRSRSSAGECCVAGSLLVCFLPLFKVICGRFFMRVNFQFQFQYIIK